MIEHCTHLITQVWTCFFYYALLNGISWNQKHPHLVTALGDLKKKKGKCENEGWLHSHA